MTTTYELIRHRINHLRRELPALQALSDRRIRIRHDGRHARATTATTPINLTAYDLLDQLTCLARLLGHAAGLRRADTMSLPILLWQLDGEHNLHALADRHDAPHIARLLDQACKAVDSMTRPDPAMRYVGICPHCRYGVWIPEHEPVTGSRPCTMCRSLIDIADVAHAHRLTLKTSGVMDTLPKLRRKLADGGITFNLATIRSWVHRGDLTPVGHTDQGEAVYALADLLVLLERPRRGVSLT